MRASGRSGQRLLNPVQLTPNARSGTLYDRLRRESVQLVLAVRIGEGSRLDTPESRATSARQGGYERYAEELEGSGNFNRVARFAMEAARLEVVLWRVSPSAGGRLPQ